MLIWIFYCLDRWKLFTFIIIYIFVLALMRYFEECIRKDYFGTLPRRLTGLGTMYY